MAIVAQKKSAANKNLVHCAITHRNDKPHELVASVEIYSGMSTVCYSSIIPKEPEINNSGGRSPITEFSRKSRRRMIQAMLKKKNYIRPLFVTLTYTDQSIGCLPGGRDYKRDIDCLNKRLQREYPNSGHIWRIEEVTRKSGRFEGVLLPHFHIVLDGILADVAGLRHDLRQWWHEIITDSACELPKPRVDVQVSKSKRHAMYYLSKYVAKESDTLQNSNISHSHKHWTGRHWAVVGNWDATEVMTIKLNRKEFLDLRRLCVRYLKSKGSDYAKRLARSKSYQGFSIYGLGVDAFGGGYIGEPTIKKMLLFVTGVYLRGL